MRAPSGRRGKVDDLRVVLLGFTVTDRHMRALGTAVAVRSAQTRNFAWSLVAALQSAGCEVALLSALPVHTFPAHRVLFARGGRFRTGGVEGRLLAFVNLHVVKHLSRLLSCLWSGLPFVRAHRADLVIVHGVHSAFLLFGRVVRRWLGLPLVVILTDPPGVVLPTDGHVIRALRRLDSWLVARALRRCDGVICLTEELGRRFAPSRQRLVLEGILHPRLQDWRPVPVDQTDERVFTVAYAGALKEEYGVGRLVDAVIGLSDEFALDIYGTGPLEAWVRRRADECPRIRYHGGVAHQELPKLLQRADVLVNPRPADRDFVKYSFPSKLIEYMGVGRPVLTTRLPGIPSEYSDKLLFAEDDSVEGLARALRAAAESPLEWRHEMATAARQFVVEERNVHAQGARIRAFCEQVVQSAGNRR